MSKKTSAIVLSSLIVMNQVSKIPVIHANNSIKSAVNQEQSTKQSQQVIYVTNGEGSENLGDGTINNPYQNIRTALEQVEDGGIIKIVGTVNYTKHEVEPTTKAALPLMIEKNITIEGASGDTTNDTLSTRAPIQLGANVTFKNMRIEMPNLNQILPGVQEPAPTPADEGVYKSGRTIYVAGHTLTLDNVNTKLGTNADQTEERPFISGGSFWAEKATGNKSVVNIINPNSETRFNSIYAGDYWYESNIPFELNLGEKTNNKTIIDNTIHTGGIMNDYSGDIKITIGGFISPTLDYTKHTGNTDVEINYSQYLGNIEFNGLRTLTLSNQAYVEVKKDSNFEVENLVVKDGSLLDLDLTDGNPIVTGDFTGDDTSAIYLNNDQTLKVNGLASGAIRLNNHSRIPSYTYSVENHVFLSANENSTMELIICEEDIEYGLRVWESVNNGIKEYSLVEATPLTGNVTINGTPKVGQILTANVVNNQTDANLEYQWFIDGNEIAGATQPTFTLTSDHVGSSISVKVASTNYTGTITSPSVTVLTNQLTGDVTITGTPKVGQTLTANPANYQNDANLEYQWFADGKAIANATQPTLTLTKDFVGQEISVQVTSSNYIGNLTSSTVVVSKNQLAGTVTITGTPKVDQTLTVDTSNLPTDANVTCQWYVNGTAINGATQSTLTLTSDYAGKMITVEVSSPDYEGVIASSEVLVLTNQAPTIHGLDSVKLNIREIATFDKLNGVTVEDDHDKNLTPSVSGEIVKPKPGQTLSSTLTYTVEDSDGNITTMTRLITVTNYLPTIEANSITIKEGETIDLLNDSRISVKATDIEDGVLTVSSFNNPNHLDATKPSVGTYPITYSVTDLDGNIAEITIAIQVQSNQAPIINGVTATTIKLREVDTFNALEGITITDDHDQNLVPTVTGTIAKPQPGHTLTSTLTYTVKDSDGNTTTLDRQIKVTNYLPTLQVNSITIKANQSIDLLSDARLNLSATDVEDGNLNSEIKVKDLGGLNPNQPAKGQYVVTYAITDLDGNTVEQSATINVESNEIPVITGVTDQTITSGQSFDLLDGVIATDVEDGDLSNNITVIGTFDPYKIGTQSITYQVTDKDGNVTALTRTITVNYQTETSTDNTVSAVYIPHTQEQLKQLVDSIKAYDATVEIVEVTEELNSNIYRLRVRSMTNDYFVEINVNKSINPEIGLPGLDNPTSKPEGDTSTPESKPEGDTSTPESKPEGDTSTPESKPEGDTSTPESKPEGDASTPESKPEGDTSTPESKPEGDASTPESKPEGDTSTLEPNPGDDASTPVTGYANVMGYIGGAFLTLGSILIPKKKKK